MIETPADTGFFNIIAPLGLGLVICYNCYKYYRDSVAPLELQRSVDICSHKVKSSSPELQSSDNIRDFH